MSTSDNSTTPSRLASLWYSREWRQNCRWVDTSWWYNDHDWRPPIASAAVEATHEVMDPVLRQVGLPIHDVIERFIDDKLQRLGEGNLD